MPAAAANVADTDLIESQNLDRIEEQIVQSKIGLPPPAFGFWYLLSEPPNRLKVSHGRVVACHVSESSVRMHAECLGAV